MAGVKRLKTGADAGTYALVAEIPMDVDHTGAQVAQMVVGAPTVAEVGDDLVEREEELDPSDAPVAPVGGRRRPYRL